MKMIKFKNQKYSIKIPVLTLVILGIVIISSTAYLATMQSQDKQISNEEQNKNVEVVDIKKESGEKLNDSKLLEPNTNQEIINQEETTGEQGDYKYDDYYPIILSLNDSKGNVNKLSNYNGISYNTSKTNTVLKVGDELILTAKAKDPKDRTLFYNWNSNSQHFNQLVGLENGDFKYTTNNELRYTIDKEDLQSGETLRIVCQIKSEKGIYRSGSNGHDDSIFLDYKLLPE